MVPYYETTYKLTFIKNFKRSNITFFFKRIVFIYKKAAKHLTLLLMTISKNPLIHLTYCPVFDQHSKSIRCQIED